MMSKQSINRRNFGFSVAGLAILSRSLHAAAQSPANALNDIKAPAELLGFNQADAWQLQGSGALRFFGFKAYDAKLWSAGGLKTNPLTDKALFALEIVYDTKIKAEEIVNVSLVEMARLRKLTDLQIKTWTADMQSTFPSVVSGDRFTGVFVPKIGTKFFLNSRLIAEINDPAFGDAFFAIWLDDGTKRPDLRKSLLGSPS